MRTRKFLLNLDLFFQTILFFGTLFSAVITIVTQGMAIYFLAIALFFLGAWQLASGFLVGLLLKDEKRLQYFFGSILYLIFLYGFGSMAFGGIGYESILLAIILSVIIPLGIAYWYLRLTNQTVIDLKNMDLKEKINPLEFENILDSDEFLNQKI